MAPRARAPFHRRARLLGALRLQQRRRSLERGALLVLIQLETLIEAPPERCFDLSLSVQLHLDSTAHTGERVVAGPTGGLLGLGDTITWEARHFGRRRRMTVRITGFDRPRWFRDEMVDGPLRRLCHDHRFEPANGGTLMRDEFEFATAFPPFDRLVLERHFRRLLGVRNDTIRRAAESEGWHRYVTTVPSAS